MKKEKRQKEEAKRGGSDVKQPDISLIHTSYIKFFFCAPKCVFVVRSELLMVSVLQFYIVYGLLLSLILLFVYHRLLI